MKKTIAITGLDCAACAAELEEELQKLTGVQSVAVSFAEQKIFLEYADEAALERAVACANAFEEVRVVEDNAFTGCTVLHLENLDCPVCAEALESDLRKIKGVKTVAVDYLSQTIRVETESETTLARVIKKTNKFEQVRVLDGDRYATNGNSRRKAWLQILLSAAFFLGGLSLQWLAHGKTASVLKYACYILAYAVVGYSVLLSTAKNVVKGKIFDENFLMTIASIGAIALGETAEGVLVMLLYQIGELLQAIAVGSSRKSVRTLMEMKSAEATVLRDGEPIIVKPEEISVGDRILVKVGEKAPVDGTLCSENAVVDTKFLTGEAEPKTLYCGEEVLSGYINAGGMYEMTATRRYEDSAVGKILEMVENASAGKAAPEKFITKFAKVYTPVVCCLALLLAVFAPLLSGLIVERRFCFLNVARWVRSALTFLVISCPCALIISVPLTYFSGIGACAKNGILVKGASYLDILAKARAMAFDKTGTLTEGNFRVSAAYPEDGVTEKELLGLVASAEYGSAHPISKAFSDYARSTVFDKIEEIAGEGLIASSASERVLVGNEKLFLREKADLRRIETAYTVVYVARNGKYVGAVEIGDRLRDEANDALTELKSLGFSRLIMLTGDGALRAQKIANEVGMSEVKAELLPNDKLAAAEEIRKDGALVYVGDGVNDAPVMTVSDCAVSMGSLGSAAAVETSDMVLISDDLSGLPRAVRIARKTRAIVMQNIGFSIVMKLAFMALGAFGVLPLWLAVFADVGVMLLAVSNSFRVRALGTKIARK